MLLIIKLYYKEKFSPKVIVLALGYGVYSIPKEGTPFNGFAVFTSGSNPL